MDDLKAWCVAFHQKNQQEGQLGIGMGKDEAEATEDVINGDEDIEVADVRLLTWSLNTHSHTIPWSAWGLVRAMVRLHFGRPAIPGYDEVLLAVAVYRSGYVRDRQAERAAALEERARGGDAAALKELAGL